MAQSKAGLPASLHAIYQRYKAGTAVLIDWLVARAPESQSQGQQAHSTKLTVRQILQLAKDVASRSVKPPGNVKDAFKVVLVNRRRLTDYFKNLEHQPAATAEATDRHIYFNEALAHAYDFLFPKVTKTVRKRRQPAPSVSEDVPLENSNRFEVLSDLIEQEPNVDTALPLPSQDKDSMSTEEPSSIEDDPLEDVIVLHSFVLEMEAILGTFHSISKSISESTMPLPLAGCLMNFAFQHVRYMTQLYGRRFGSHATLEEKYCTQIATLDSRPDVQKIFDARAQDYKEATGPQSFTEGTGLWFPAEIIRGFKQRTLETGGFSTIPERKKIHEYFLTPAQEADAEIQQQEGTAQQDPTRISALEMRYKKGALAIDSIFTSICQYSQSDTVRATNLLFAMVHDHSEGSHCLFQQQRTMPLFLEFMNFIVDPEMPLYSDLVCGVTMLLESCKASIWQDEKPNPINLRIKALQFAKEVRTSIEEVRDIDNHPVQSSHALNGRDEELLSNVSDLLKRFTLDAHFDLYHQSTWVAASNMSAILGNAQGLGLVMLGQKAIIGSVLHTYNMVQQLGLVPKIDILEELCNLLVKQVFLGIRPQKRFSSLQNRFRGGSLKYNDGAAFITPPNLMGMHKRDQSPLGLLEKRFTPYETSLFVDMIMTGGRPHDPFWSQLATDSKSQTLHARESLERVFRKQSGFVIVEKAKRLLEREAIGRLPLAKLNCFKAYKLGLDILENLARAYASPNLPSEFDYLVIEDEGRDLSLVSASRFQQFMMLEVDELMKHKRTGAILKKHAGLLMIRDAIVKACEGKKVEDFLWKGI